MLTVGLDIGSTTVKATAVADGKVLWQDYKRHNTKQAETVLDPAVTVKIPRAAVYGVLLRSAALVWSNVGLGRYCRALDHRLDSGRVGT